MNRAMFCRGYLEEAFTVDGNWGAFQGAGTTEDGTTYGFTNFEWLGGTGRGAWCYKDGEPLVWAAWSQIATIGDAEEVILRKLGQTCQRFQNCRAPL